MTYREKTETSKATLTGYVLSVLAVLMAIAIYIQGVDPNADNKQGHSHGGYEGGDDMYLRMKSE